MIQSNNTKLKAGTEYLYQGENVFVEHDRENGLVSVCWNQARGLNDYYEVVNKADLKPVNPGRSPIKTSVKPLSEEEKKFKADLHVFFASQILTIPDACENCGQKLNCFTSRTRSSCIAHILPKGKNNGNFKSVACHPLNRMFLGPFCGCHHKYDHAKAEERVNMPCYKLAIERFNQFKDKMPGPEQIRAFKYLAIEL